eukprot:3416035-Heterocapsa_arctica.AAC.1
MAARDDPLQERFLLGRRRLCALPRRCPPCGHFVFVPREVGTELVRLGTRGLRLFCPTAFGWSRCGRAGHFSEAGAADVHELLWPCLVVPVPQLGGRLHGVADLVGLAQGFLVRGALLLIVRLCLCSCVGPGHWHGRLLAGHAV